MGSFHISVDQAGRCGRWRAVRSFPNILIWIKFLEAAAEEGFVWKSRRHLRRSFRVLLDLSMAMDGGCSSCICGKEPNRPADVKEEEEHHKCQIDVMNVIEMLKIIKKT